MKDTNGDLFPEEKKVRATAETPATARRGFEIPAGTRASKCQACPATIYWITHPSSGRGHPVSIADPVTGELYADAKEATATEPGRGRSHFSDCPEAERFRKKK